MTGPAPSVAAIRVAVRGALADLAPATPLVVALSGGPDSLALLAAAAWLRPGAVTAVVVDQGWSPGSAVQAQRAAEQAVALGAAAQVLAAPTARDEAAAREARYAALAGAADRLGAPAVLLGHTRDDQAETVLLGLARGSGPRSLAGMAPLSGLLRRPLLGLPRATTLAACAALGLAAWDDPANADPAFTRVRVRERVLPMLGEQLGHDIRPNLARTAELLRADADLLDELAQQAACGLTAEDGSLDAAGVAALPAALRRRVLHSFAGESGAAPSLVQVQALEALATDWHGQGPVALAGGRGVARSSGRIRFVPESAAASEPTLAPGISKVLISEAQIQDKIRELAARIDADHAGEELVLVAVLKGAIMVMADLSRALTLSVNLEFMAVSSYGAATSSSGVVRILKDLDRDIRGRHVLVVEDIIDSGLTLSWLVRNLAARHPASLEVCALLRKPEAVRNSVEVRYVGFDLGPEFVVGYGLDYAERYRTLRYVGLFDPSAID